MAIQLEKILSDIAKEKALLPNNGGVTKQEQDEAWARIGRLNKLSVHESRSIFIVLQKKYEQEKQKDNSSWKLFNLMQQIYQETKPQSKEDEEHSPMEEVEEFEMLEVQEQEDDEEGNASGSYTQPAKSSGSAASSDGESPSKSSSTPEKEERVYKKTIIDTPRPANEEKKLLNTMAHNTAATRANTVQSSVSAAAAVLQKKGITVKKAPSMTKPGGTAAQQQSNNKAPTMTARTTIQLPDSLKRKLSEDYNSIPQRKVTKSNSLKQTATSGNPTTESASSGVVHTTTAQLMQVKKEREDNQSPPPGINIITIPPAPLVNGNNVGCGLATSSTAATVASTSTNGFSPHVQELDFKNDIIFHDGGNGHIKGNSGATTSEIINLGNFDNSLPPTFFKNLYNSSRHEALGLYVANVMNRISQRAAAKLELGILRAIVDVQSDELEQ